MSTNLAPRRRLVDAVLAMAVAFTLAACGEREGLIQP